MSEPTQHVSVNGVNVKTSCLLSLLSDSQLEKKLMQLLHLILIHGKGMIKYTIGKDRMLDSEQKIAVLLVIWLMEKRT